MPLTQEQIQQMTSDWSAEQEQKQNTANQPDFGVPEQPKPDEQIGQMPNSDKLTKFEKWTYGKLPGVTSWMENNRIMGGTISEQLDKFNNSWMGKALNKLDFLAEGLERTSGLVAQMATDPDFDMDELKSAWYAGSLTYDVANLPTLKRDEAGKVIGLELSTDLPGSGGLSDARAKIQGYMDQGMSAQDALAKVRDETYNGLGALALRAQMHDLAGHVLLDPLNLLTGYLKPVEALKARRFSALATKLTGGVEEFAQSASKAEKLLSTAENAEDALKYADEAFQLTQLAGDSKRAAELAQKAAEAAKAAGKTEDAAKYASEAARLANMAPEEAARFSEDALRAIGKKQLNTADKFAIMMTGGDPFRPSALGKKLENVPVLGKVANLFQLTPESKARELMTLMQDNLGVTFGRMLKDSDTEAQLMSYVRRVGKGATGIEYGHSFATLEGRTVQAFSKGSETAIEEMFQHYQEIAPSSQKLQHLSEVLGESPEKLLRLMDENPDAVMGMIQKHAALDVTLQGMLQNGELTADSLKATSKIIGDLPYNKEMFVAKAMDIIETTAMRQAVLQFGVKEKGVLTRWSDAMKSAESLAFLKLNPGYPIRNKINNDVTMLARGLFGFVDDAGIDKFWDDFGTLPARMDKAEMATELAGVSGKLKEADKLLAEALRGGNYGTPEKVKEFFSKINLGKADFAGHWGQKLERAARRKAQTLGTQQFLRRYFKPKAAKEYISPKVMDAVSQIAPDFERELNNAIRASGAMDAKLDDLLKTNLNLNVDSVLDNVTENLGVDARAMLGDEVLEHIHQGLGEAIQNNKVDSFIQATKQKLNNHIEDLFQKQLENVVEHTKAQAVAGGPNVWNQKLGEAQDLFWGAHIEYSGRMPEATRLAREASSAGDFNAARSLWAKEAEDGRLFYDRAFRRVDAYIEGLEAGTKHLADQGVKLPFTETRRTFKQWKGMWQDFHKTKNEIIEKFFENPQGKKFDDVQKQLDTMYQKAIEQEDAFSQRLDDTIASMIDNPQAKAAYTNARDQLAQMRRADKEIVADIRKEIADLPKEQRQERWNAFWQERAGRYQEMRQVDAASVMIQQGDPNATQMFAQAGETARATSREAVKGAQMTAASPEVGEAEKAFMTGAATPELKAQHPYLSAAFDDKATSYPTKNIQIEKAKNLTPQQRLVESRFAQKIDSDVEGSIAEYWKARKPSDANVLNVDFARELSPDYNLDKMNNAAAVQKPSSALVRKMWEQKLAEKPVGDNVYDNIIFTAGGGGSGKGSASAIQGVDLTSSHLVWDMTMSEEKDLKYIEQAVASGRNAQIIYVARDPVDALMGAAERAGQEGRVLPLSVWAEAHAGAPDTFRTALKKFAGNESVDLRVINNTGEYGFATEVPVDFMTNRVYNKDELLTEGRAALEKGFQNGDIDEQIYRATLGDEVAGKGGISQDITRSGTGGSEQGVTESRLGSNSPEASGQPQQQITQTTEQGTRATQKGVQPNFIADVKKVIPDPQPIDFSLDLMAYGKQHAVLDEIVNGAKQAAQKTPTLLSDLPANLQDEVQKALRQVKNDFASTRYQAMKFGEWRADSAILNYNRRTNFDNYVGHVAPFAFWGTSSMFQWAVESIDRPAMLTNYLRAKQFMSTAGLHRDGMASRTKGKIRIDLPFAPSWMGEQFIDPMRLALPFDNWVQPFEQFQKDQEGAEGRTQRVLDEQLAQKQISQAEYNDAVANRSGAVWDYAEAQMQQNDQSDRYDAWDFGTSLMSPHAPIMWAYNAAFGDKQDIGPFSPLSRIARNTATQLGVEDWNNSKWNLEAKVRKQMGLPAFDKFDDYRIKRAASDLAGDGTLTPDEMKEAIAVAAMVEKGQLEPEEAKRQSEAYKMAVARSNKEYTGGPAGYALGLLGISVTSVPQGENNLRALQDDFGNAYGKYKEADDSLTAYLDAHPEMTQDDASDAWAKANPKLSKDADALTEFFDKYPEYEGRLGLFDDPETQVKKFMVDEVWKAYNEMPKVNQDEIRDQLGQDFQDAFLNSATRSYDDIPSETMAVWLKLMHVDPLGGLTADQRLLTNLYGPLKLTDPEMANRVQVFYDTRKNQYPNYYKLQSEYYQKANYLDKKKFLKDNPELQQYFDFRRQFMRDNPDAVSYLTDNQEAIDKAKKQTRNPEVAVPTANEIRGQMTPPMQRLLSSYDQGEELPFEAEQQLEMMADDYNLTFDQLLNILQAGVPQ